MKVKPDFSKDSIVSIVQTLFMAVYSFWFMYALVSLVTLYSAIISGTWSLGVGDHLNSTNIDRAAKVNEEPEAYFINELQLLIDSMSSVSIKHFCVTLFLAFIVFVLSIFRKKGRQLALLLVFLSASGLLMALSYNPVLNSLLENPIA